MKAIHIGIIKEDNHPSEKRSPLSPEQCIELMQKYPQLKVSVQKSEQRCFSDQEFETLGVKLTDDVSKSDIIVGIQAISAEQLISGKTYLYFSDVLKKGAEGLKSLHEIIEKKIRLIDYSCLTDDRGVKLLGFGRFAGVISIHKALKVYGKRSRQFSITPTNEKSDYQSIKDQYHHLVLPPIKIVITGNGRVSKGAIELLDSIKIRKVNLTEFLEEEFDEAVYVQLKYRDLYKRIDDGTYREEDFFANPGDYRCDFSALSKVSDILLNGVSWDPNAPVFFNRDTMKDSGFNIKVISDISSNLFPDSPLPSSVRLLRKGEMCFGFDPKNNQETFPHQPGCVDVIAQKHQSNELPVDASVDFGAVLIDQILPELTKSYSFLLNKGTIIKDGDISAGYEYLRKILEPEVFE